MYDMNEVMKFLDSKGRVKNYPSKRKKKICVLGYLIEKFQENRDYTEQEVNEVIGKYHTFNDVCYLRRELVVIGYLNRKRDCSKYWRSEKEIIHKCNERKELINMEQFKNGYIEALNFEIKNLKVNANKLKSEGSADEAKFEMIKSNIVDIYSKIFMVAYNNVFVKVNHECLRSIVEENTDNKDKLIKCYEFLLNKVTEPWSDKLEKDKEFNLVEETFIEEVKIQQSEKIHNMFRKMINLLII